MRAAAAILLVAAIGLGSAQDLRRIGSDCWEHRYLVDFHAGASGQNHVFTVPHGKSLVLTDLVIMSGAFNQLAQIRRGIDGPILASERTADRQALHRSWKSPPVLNAGDDLILEIGSQTSSRISVLGLLVPESTAHLPPKCSYHLEAVHFQGSSGASGRVLYRVPGNRILVLTDLHLQQGGNVPVNLLRDDNRNGPVRLHLAHSEVGDLRATFSSGIRFGAGKGVFLDYVSGDSGGAVDARGYLVPIEKKP